MLTLTVPVLIFTSKQPIIQLNFKLMSTGLVGMDTQKAARPFFLTKWRLNGFRKINRRRQNRNYR